MNDYFFFLPFLPFPFLPFFPVLARKRDLYNSSSIFESTLNSVICLLSRTAGSSSVPPSVPMTLYIRSTATMDVCLANTRANCSRALASSSVCPPIELSPNLIVLRLVLSLSPVQISLSPMPPSKFEVKSSCWRAVFLKLSTSPIGFPPCSQCCDASVRAYLVWN